MCTAPSSDPNEVIDVRPEPTEPLQIEGAPSEAEVLAPALTKASHQRARNDKRLAPVTFTALSCWLGLTASAPPLPTSTTPCVGGATMAEATAEIGGAEAEAVHGSAANSGAKVDEMTLETIADEVSETTLDIGGAEAST